MHSEMLMSGVKRNELYLPLECDTLTNEMRLKAKVELGETDEVRQRCLEQLRDIIKEESSLQCNTSDLFLLQFLRLRKFDVPSAFSRLKSYYGHRWANPDLYKNYSPQQCEDTIEQMVMTFLPRRTEEGCAVWAVRLGAWDPSRADTWSLLRLGLVCNEHALRSPLTQVSGVVSVVDMRGLSWTHLLALTPSSLRSLVSASQDCFPIRHKAIHVINNPSIFGIVFAVIRPLLNRKIRERIHFHGSKMENLRTSVPPEILPDEFGGSAGAFGNDKFFKSLLDSEHVFLEAAKFGYRRPP